MPEAYDRLGRLDTAALYQPFLAKLNTLLNACAARGAIYVATSGLRTYEAQNALYARGRSLPGGIVTNARGGQSLHNFALAVDFARHAGAEYHGKLIPDYRHPQYVILGEEAANLGLEWGGGWRTFKDVPHIQLPYNRLHKIRLTDLDREYRQGGYPAVFAFLDRFPW